MLALLGKRRQHKRQRPPQRPNKLHPLILPILPVPLAVTVLRVPVPTAAPPAVRLVNPPAVTVWNRNQPRLMLVVLAESPLQPHVVTPMAVVVVTPPVPKQPHAVPILQQQMQWPVVPIQRQGRRIRFRALLVLLRMWQRVPMQNGIFPLAQGVVQ
jgi:hypothetical protein